MIAHIQLRHGAAARERFNEALTALLPRFEEQGWRLVGAFISDIGMLNELWDVWEVRDANHVVEAQVGLRAGAGWGRWSQQLSDVIISEQLHYVRKLPFSP